jgi:hypothetical protein
MLQKLFRFFIRQEDCHSLKLRSELKSNPPYDVHREIDVFINDLKEAKEIFPDQESIDLLDSVIYQALRFKLEIEDPENHIPKYSYILNKNLLPYYDYKSPSRKIHTLNENLVLGKEALGSIDMNFGNKKIEEINKIYPQLT